MSEVVKDWVDHHARQRPAAVALASVETGTTVTWAELEHRVGRLARVLAERGVGPGDRVCLLAENDPRVFETQFACMRTGAVLVPLSWRLTAAELRQQLRDAGPRLLVHDGSWSALAATLAGDAGIPTLGWGAPAAEPGYESAIAAARRPVAGGELDPDAVTQVMYTSGTTGEPKGVLCTNRTLVTQAQNLAHSSRMSQEGGHHLNIVPLFHAGGLNVFSNPMLFWGGRVSTVGRFDAARTIELLADTRLGITHLCGVQQMYEWMTARPEFSSAVFPALRTVLFGGWGPAAGAVCRAWADRGIAVQLSYGASELGPNVTILSAPEPGAAERGTSGTVLPHTAVRLVTDGRDVPTGQTGEVWVRGPGVTPGYWGKPRDGFFSGDWFRTGDAARMDAAGHLYVVGRLTERYRSGGENVYPAEVEAVLAQMPGVAELAVLGVPDDRWGESGLVAIVPTPGCRPTLEQVRDFAADRLARFKLPSDLLLLDVLPRSATEKVVRARIRELWEARAGA